MTTVLLFECRDSEAGGFSIEGIETGNITDDGNTLSCFSSHLTSFAVLADATGPGDTVMN